MDGKHPPGYGFGMVVSLVLGMAVAGGIWHLAGSSFGVITFIVGLLIAPLFWGLLRPVFLVLGALPGYWRSPIRRQFKAAWKRVDHDTLLRDPVLATLWRRRGSRDTLYLWLKEEWSVDFMAAGIPALEWLTRLVDASKSGELARFWLSRPDTSEVRAYQEMYAAERMRQIM